MNSVEKEQVTSIKWWLEDLHSSAFSVSGIAAGVNFFSEEGLDLAPEFFAVVQAVDAAVFRMVARG